MNPFILETILDGDAFVSTLLPMLHPHTILALSGPLGAGKTTCVQALARALGISRIPTSPTFSLVRTYPVKHHPSIKKLIHVDAYRIEYEEDIRVLGLEELLLEEGTLLCLEWPENVAKWLEQQSNVVRIQIALASDGRRILVQS